MAIRQAKRRTCVQDLDLQRTRGTLQVRAESESCISVDLRLSLVERPRARSTCPPRLRSTQVCRDPSPLRRSPPVSWLAPTVPNPCHATIGRREERTKAIEAGVQVSLRSERRRCESQRKEQPTTHILVQREYDHGDGALGGESLPQERSYSFRTIRGPSPETTEVNSNEAKERKVGSESTRESEAEAHRRRGIVRDDVSDLCMVHRGSSASQLIIRRPVEDARCRHHRPPRRTHQPSRSAAGSRSADATRCTGNIRNAPPCPFSASQTFWRGELR